MIELSQPGDVRLRHAIEACYAAFAAPVPPVIEGCPCCIGTRGVDVLLTTGLRTLSGQALWRYVSGVFYTVGGERDFRYLLPRIFEISVVDPGNANEPEIVLCKLALANWQNWTDRERSAIEEFVYAWFDHALALDLAESAEGWIGQDAESVLCGAARAGFALAPFLVRLHQPLAAPVLADMKARFPEALSAFWEDCPGGFAELSVIFARGKA